MSHDLDDTVAAPPRREARRPGAASLDDDTVPLTDFVRAPAPLAPSRAEPRPPRAPALRLVLADGAEIALDTTVYVGRRPSTPRIYQGPAPRLVAVSSPQREVSATHAEFRRLGDSTVVADLRSTNGTIVTVPGSPPRVLLGGESAVVTPGTLVDLGDGNVLRIASAALGAAASASLGGSA